MIPALIVQDPANCLDDKTMFACSDDVFPKTPTMMRSPSQKREQSLPTPQHRYSVVKGRPTMIRSPSQKREESLPAQQHRYSVAKKRPTMIRSPSQKREESLPTQQHRYSVAKKVLESRVSEGAVKTQEQKKSCIKVSRRRRCSQGAENNGMEKTVRFQQENASSDDEFCCSIQKSATDPPVPQKELWWSKAELSALYDKEMVLLAKFMQPYSKTIKAAIKEACESSQKGNTDSREDDDNNKGKCQSISLCVQAFCTFEDMRGLEQDCYPSLKQFRKKHRRAVLSAQNVRRDVEWLRWKSEQWSQPYCWFSAKLAEFDQLSAQSRWSEQVHRPKAVPDAIVLSPSNRSFPSAERRLRLRLTCQDSAPVLAQRLLSPVANPHARGKVMLL